MNNETTKPLYKVLNEKRTQGEWFEEYDNDEFWQFYSLFGAEGENVLRYSYGTVKDEEYKANAQYTALAVNNLHILAEALKNMLDFFETYPPHFADGKSMATDIGNFSEQYEALARISYPR